MQGWHREAGPWRLEYDGKRVLTAAGAAGCAVVEKRVAECLKLCGLEVFAQCARNQPDSHKTGQSGSRTIFDGASRDAGIESHAADWKPERH